MKNITLLFFILFSVTIAGKEGVLIDFTRGGMKSSAPGIKMTLRGNSRILPDGKKSILHINPGKKGSSGILLNDLSRHFIPNSGFLLEITFRMDPLDYRDKRHFSVLFDSFKAPVPGNKTRETGGIRIGFMRDNYLPMYTPQILFRLGKKSQTFTGRFIPVDNKEHTLSLEYIPGGRGRLLLDGKENIDFPLPAAPSITPLGKTFIGDRKEVPSFPFNGKIAGVKITPLPLPLLEVIPQGRRAFFRNEKGAFFKLDLKNMSRKTLSDISLQADLGGFPLKEVKVKQLLPSQKKEILLPLVTLLREGAYKCKLSFRGTAGGSHFRRTLEEELFIGPPPQKERMPIFIWGYGHWDYNVAKAIGFTHTVEWYASHVYVRHKSNPDFLNRLHYRYLDDMLRMGMGTYDLFHAAYMHKKFPRIGRDGTPYKTAHPNMDATNPAGIRETLEVASKTADAYKDHPAYEGTLLNSEIRDNSRPSFAPHQLAYYRKKFGREIPQEASGRAAPHYANIKNFPFDRILDEKDPLFRYYVWFWKEGDGWNPLHSKLHDVFKKAIKRPDYKTMYDPAVRVPPIWGNGGKVDILSHWTYAYPDPIRIAVSTEENIAMARGGNQDLYNMTQLISYRSRTAPLAKKLPGVPSWAKESPRAKYVTLAPDMMRIALWSQLSRRVSGIMFHGFNTLLKPANREGLKGTGYICTNEETVKVLREMFANIVVPFGPVLKKIPERTKKVAILESFTSSMFSENGGTMGHGGWTYDAHLMLLWANMAPGVIYEEDILYKDALKDVKVLVMPSCEILPRKVYEAIIRFQEKGGLIVGDEYLVPTITPDISINSIKRVVEHPRETRESLVKTGLSIRKALAPFYTPYVAAGNESLVTHVRSSREADYLFVINDKRTFGSYWGPYGLVEEKGVENRGSITLARKNTGVIYDLLSGKEVPFSLISGRTRLGVNMKGGEGRLYLILPRKIRKAVLEAPAKASLGKPFTVKASILDAKGPVTHIHPLFMEVKDPAGKTTSDTSYGALENGCFKKTLLLPLNGQKGYWTVTVRDLASGKKASGKILIQ